MHELLKLPLQVQAILVAGYLGYLIYKRDHRKNENQTDMLMLILLFGLPTALILHFDNDKIAYLSVFLGLLFALLWVKTLSKYWTNFLYKHDISHTLNEGDVWKTLSSTKGVAATQIILYHKNGKRYMCAATLDFVSEPFAPFTMDDDGIAFYVTDVWDKDNNKWLEIQDVILQPEFGSNITYFPKADIEMMDFRFSRRVKT